MSDNSRRGPWSEAERVFITENCDNLSHVEIARQLRRNPDAVKKYIQKTLGRRIKKVNTDKVYTSLSAGTNIEKSIIWYELQQEFNEEELELFLYHWNRIITQFKEDVFPTEEMQIVDTIKLDILMGRALRQQHETLKDCELLQKEIEAEQAGENNLETLTKLRQQLSNYKGAFQSLTREYNDLLQRKASMLKEMKSTRADRIKVIENSKQTFAGWVAEVLNNTKLRKELGLYLEKMRIAISVEEARLQQPFKYADGELDLPMLTSDTIEKLVENQS